MTALALAALPLALAALIGGARAADCPDGPTLTRELGLTTDAKYMGCGQDGKRFPARRGRSQLLIRRLIRAISTRLAPRRPGLVQEMDSGATPRG